MSTDAPNDPTPPAAPKRRRQKSPSNKPSNGYAPGAARTLNRLADEIQHEKIDGRILELNAKHAVICEGGKTVIITERMDTQLRRRVLDRSSANDFQLRYRNRLVSDGPRFTPLGKFWLEHPLRRQYDEIVFDPTPGLESRPEVYNLWKGWPHEPHPGKWPLFRKHLFEVGASSDDDIFEFMLDWFARLFQVPQEPAGTAIVWRGTPGSGKGFIARTLGQLVGQYFVHVSRVQHLVGNFNGHLQDALLVFSDEAFWAGDRASEGALKTLITEPTLVVERKGRDAIIVPNRSHVVMATNNDWAVPMGMGDRRFLVVDVPDTYADNRKYFGAIIDELEAGGLKAFFWDMLHRPVDKPPAIPKSATAMGAALTQKTYSMTPVQQWWFAKLEDGHMTPTVDGFGGEIARDELHDDYIRTMAKLNVSRRAAQIELGINLRKMCPDVLSVHRRESLGRKRYWVFPSLKACREAFWKVLGMPDYVPWDGQTEDEEGGD